MPLPARVSPVAQEHAGLRLHRIPSTPPRPLQPPDLCLTAPSHQGDARSSRVDVRRCAARPRSQTEMLLQRHPAAAGRPGKCADCRRGHIGAAAAARASSRRASGSSTGRSSSSGRRGVLAPVRAAGSSGEQGDVLADIKRVAKKIQGSLPIVGLLSRLSAPGGGFDEISYPEFCRAAYDVSDPRVNQAVVDMEQRYGKLGQSRWLYLMLWMAKHGNGLVPPRSIYLAAKRLRVTQDTEIEVDRFENARDAALAKYRMMQRPKGKLAEGLALAVDGIAILCLGLGDGEAVPAADEQMLAAIVGYVFDDASAEDVLASIRGRPERVSAYNA